MKLAWFVLLVGCADASGPLLTSVTPAAAPPGAQVMLVGERLCGDGGNCETAAGEIQIGLDLPATLATVIEYEDHRAIIELPRSTAVGPTELVVTVNDRTSNALGFEVEAP